VRFCSPLLLEFLVVLAGEVTAHKGLHPSDNLAETVITELLHGTQDTGTEEHLRGFGQVSSPCGKCADVEFIFCFSSDEAVGHEIKAACSCDSASLYLHALRLAKRGSGGESLKRVILA
jgi:hypothetical protein